MSNEKERQDEALDQEALEQVSGGVQAGQILMSEWWDEFGNHYVKDSTGKVHIYKPSGEEITASEKPKKKTYL